MFSVSGLIKTALGAGIAAGVVFLVSRVEDGSDLKNQAAGILHSGAKGLRWAANQVDSFADVIEAQDSQAYVDQQWAKVEAAQGEQFI